MGNIVKLSKYLSYVLRHRPDSIGLVLDKEGWASVAELQAFSVDENPFTLQELYEVVETNDKKRFAFNEDKSKIRASQGHSIAVEIKFEKRIPKGVLYHGTVERNVKAILKQGLKSMNRTHVHMSDNLDTAISVGKRYGTPIILIVDAMSMYKDGLPLYISANGVWLADEVPAKYITLL